ncbi:UNVERIFIED_CONTAM: hypothetical protein GTU68_002661, partial [Idotea baltica]|nr:hypothetical protein [Idotea baltica]
KKKQGRGRRRATASTSTRCLKQVTIPDTGVSSKASPSWNSGYIFSRGIAASLLSAHYNKRLHHHIPGNPTDCSLLLPGELRQARRL